MNAPPSPNALILEAQADFALNLLRELSKDGRSSIVSPFSVATVLSMVYAGAKETTNEQMGQLLAKGEPEANVHQYFGDLLYTITNGQQGNYTLEVANKLYVKDGFEVLDGFKEKITEHYGGQFEAVNFADAVGTAKKVNDFVKEGTHGKFRDVITPDLLNKRTRLLLVNAIYFKGSWEKKFDSNYTNTKPFYMDEQNSKELDMMHKMAYFIYFENDQLQLLGMPYQGADVFMFVLLPKKRFGLATMLNNLDGKTLLELTQKRDKRKVEVDLPKFKLESTHELNKPLATLGMATAFSDLANFEGITEAEPLKISEVVQKAFIEVNEEGTEAAATTRAKGKQRSSKPIKPKAFVADHPFILFVIRDNSVLFNAIFK